MFQARGGTISALAVLTILSVSPLSADSIYTPWYWQPPLLGTAVGHYYSYHPDQVPGYPHELRGYPVPIYSINGRRQASGVRYRIGLPTRHGAKIDGSPIDRRTTATSPYSGHAGSVGHRIRRRRRASANDGFTLGAGISFSWPDFTVGMQLAPTAIDKQPLTFR